MTASGMSHTATACAAVWFTVIGAGGCSGTPGYVVAVGAKGRVPPPWKECSEARSSAPSVVKISGASFLARKPGNASIFCKQRSLTMNVRPVASIRIERPLKERGRATLWLNAYDKKGAELSLFDATGIMWTFPAELRQIKSCGHGQTYCDPERVLIVTPDVPGSYRVQARYGGHHASIDLVFED